MYILYIYFYLSSIINHQSIINQEPTASSQAYVVYIGWAPCPSKNQNIKPTPLNKLLSRGGGHCAANCNLFWVCMVFKKRQA